MAVGFVQRNALLILMLPMLLGCGATSPVPSASAVTSGCPNALGSV